VKITDAVSLAKRAYDAPVSVWHGEPLAITRSDVDVDGTKIVVLLMTGRSTTGYLETERSCELDYEIEISFYNLKYRIIENRTVLIFSDIKFSIIYLHV
jgi:hypothetical protein